MKTKILSFLFVLTAVLLISTSAYAQPTTPSTTQASSADAGATIHYIVGTGTGTWTWAVVQTTGTSGIPTLAANTTNDQVVTWPAGAAEGDVFSLRAYYKNATGCYSEMIAYTVTITKKTIQFTTSGAAQNATACSDLTGSVEGGDYTGNETTNVDKVLQSVSFDGTANLATVTYTIFDGTNYFDASLLNPTVGVQTLTATNTPNTDKILDLVTNIAYINNSGSDKTFTVTLTGATTVSGSTITAGVEKTSTIIVKAKPVIAF